MEKRYVIGDRINRHYGYSLKNSEYFDPSTNPIIIASLLCDHGYKTKRAAKKAYDKICTSQGNFDDIHVDEVELLEFTVDFEKKTIRYKSIESREFPRQR